MNTTTHEPTPGTVYVTCADLVAANLNPGSIVTNATGVAWQIDTHHNYYAAAPSSPVGGINDTYDAPFALVLHARPGWPE